MKKLINKLLIAMIIIPILLGMGCSVMADDILSNTGVWDPVQKKEITTPNVYGLSSRENIGEDGEGYFSTTKYTIKVGATSKEFVLDPGDEFGSSSMKGYIWYSVEGNNLSYLPPSGELIIERKDVIEFLHLNNQTKLEKAAAEEVVEVIVEPVLNIKNTSSSSSEKLTIHQILDKIANDKVSLADLEYKKKWQPIYDETTNSVVGWAVRETMARIWEENPNAYDWKYRSMEEILNKLPYTIRDKKGAYMADGEPEGPEYGWGGYTFEPEDVPPPTTEIELPEQESFTYAKIDNDQFEVYDSQSIFGNPIPAGENLYIEGKSNLYGFVDGLKIIKKYVGNEKFTGKIQVEYPIINNGTFEYRTKTKQYNNESITDDNYRYVTCLDASELEDPITNFDFLIENPIFGEGDSAKQIFNSNNLNLGKVTVKKGKYSGAITEENRFVKKTSSVSKSFEIDPRDKQVLDELYELSKSGTTVAITRFEKKLDEIQNKMNAILYSPNHFYNIKGDKPTVTVNGKTYELTANGAILGDLYEIEKRDISTKEAAENKSVFMSGAYTCYITNSDILVNSEVMEDNIFSPDYNRVNHVRVHTPISNKTSVTGGTPVDGSENAITVQPEDEITVNLKTENESEYYNDISGFDITKYIKTKKIKCTICNKEVDGISHKCKIPKDAKEGTNYTITTTVIAQNGKDDETRLGYGDINKPDNEYALTKTISIGVGVPPPETTPPETTPPPTTPTTPPTTPDPSIPGTPITGLDGAAGEAHIDDQAGYFNVYQGVNSSGNPIPTSEDLKVEVSTDLVGVVRGFETVNTKINVSGYYSAYYKEPDDFVGGSVADTLEKALEDCSMTSADYDYYTTAIVNGSKVYYFYENGDSGYAYSRDYSWSDVSVSYQEISGDQEFGILDHVIVSNDTLGGDIELAMNPTVSVTDWHDYSNNITYNTSCSIGSTYSSYSSAKYAVDNKTPYASDFYSKYNDYVRVKVNGSNKDYTQDSYVSSSSKLTAKEENITVPNLANKSSGTAYPSEANHYIKWIEGPEAGRISKAKKLEVNNVRVHTPVHLDLQLDTTGKTNQLNNNTTITSNNIGTGIHQNKIVKLGDAFDVKINIKGNSTYYSSISQVNTSKYVKDIRVDCDVCGAMNQQISKSDLVHHCPGAAATKQDNKSYEITVRVKAENEKNSNIQSATTNTPDNYYVIEQTIKVFVVGKIYDLEIRTVDDPAWKLQEAEKLAKLPTGEKGDNSIVAYKNGIKLGYRAYFDLKTLGNANTTIELKPKIYYVSLDGSTIKSDIDLYYRDRTGYKKLTDLDITMNMATTKGSEKNLEFVNEQAHAKKSSAFSGVNYAEKLTLGKYNGGEFTLTQKNATITKYNGTYYIQNDGNVSRRWHGEIYMPASTVVVPSGTTLANVANGSKTFKSGYLLVVFEDINSTAGGNEYLNYNVMRNGAGQTTSPTQLAIEKGTKNSITLPNGKVITSVASEAPMIIYDVSLRANNDFESTGTH